MSHALQCRQFCALICSRSVPCSSGAYSYTPAAMRVPQKVSQGVMLMYFHTCVDLHLRCLLAASNFACVMQAQLDDVQNDSMLLKYKCLVTGSSQKASQVHSDNFAVRGSGRKKVDIPAGQYLASGPA